MDPRNGLTKRLVRSVVVAGSFLLCASVMAAVPRNSGDAVVRLLYKNYAWQVLFATPEFKPLTDQPDEELAKYFSPAMVHLLHDDRACRERTHEVCGLDFDPLFDSQDPSSIYDLDTERRGDEVSVTFRQESRKVALVFKLKMESGGWRIDDIVYPEGTKLRSLLEAGK